MTAKQQRAFINSREDSPVQFLGIPTVVRATGEATNGAFSLIEHLSVPPGFASPYHMHHLEDEAFYILEGKVAFICDGNWLDAGPGNFVYGPRRVPHGFKLEDPGPAKMLVWCSPAGFEKFILELGQPPGEPPSPPDMEKLMATAMRYQIEILGPLPERPAMPA
jgi:mannose-6-phosphate isomerase-like protein (cupin superfamily)